MSTKVLESTAKCSAPTKQLDQVGNSVAAMTSQEPPANGTHELTHDLLPALPTFPLEAGWRTVYDATTDSYQQQPLTLRDLLFPTEDDIGVVYMTQSILHNLLTDLLAVMLRTYLGAQDWLILHDVLILWDIRGAPAKSPDVAAFPHTQPAIKEKSYRVGRDGPTPAFVIEITSDDTRADDLQVKPLHYAAVGIKEYLIIDILTKATEPWALIGYRLADGPYYQRMTPDAEGGLTFTTVGLRFVAIDRMRIEVYDSATGQRLFTSDELKAQAEAQSARAEAEAARAEAEATARIEAEARAADLERRLRALENQLGRPSTTTDSN